MAKQSEKTEPELTESQKEFCKAYIFDWNGTRAYLKAYPESSEAAARSSASELLTKPNIKAFIAEIQKDLEKLAGISRLKLITEHQKIAFSSIAHLHDTWLTRKEFESLTDDQKSAIEEISTKQTTEKDAYGNPISYEYIKIKLYNKQKSLDSLTKILGHESAQKVEHTITALKGYQITPASGKGTVRK